MSRPTRLLSGNTLYWTIRLYDDSQVLVDADSTPTVAVRKNGASVADAVTVTKRAATTGIYDCSYNPAGEAEGDQYTLEESATVSAVTYENNWAVVVEAVERGTDGANTVAPVDVSSDVTAIKAKTDQLAFTVANQVDANALTGGGGDDAATIYTYFTAGSNEDAFKADVSGLSTFNPATDTVANVTTVQTTVSNSDMRGTDNALLAASAPTNWPLMDINASGEITTSNPASGGGSLHTAEDVRDLILAGDKTPIVMATGSVSNVVLVDTTTDLTNGGGGGPGGGDDAATIYAYFTSSGREVTFRADTTGLSTFDHNTDQVVASNMRGTDGANTVSPDNAGIAANGVAIAALNDFDPSVDVVARVTLVDTTTDLTNQSGGGGDCPTAQEIVDAWGNQPQGVYTTPDTLGFYLDAQVSTAGSGGAGLYQVTVNVRDESLNALQGARVNVDGTTLTLTTDSAGQVVFNLDSGVYTLEVSPPAGYNTPVGQVVTVAASDISTSFTLSGNGECSVPWLG